MHFGIVLAADGIWLYFIGAAKDGPRDLGSRGNEIWGLCAEPRN